MTGNKQPSTHTHNRQPTAPPQGRGAPGCGAPLFPAGARRHRAGLRTSSAYLVIPHFCAIYGTNTLTDTRGSGARGVSFFAQKYMTDTLLLVGCDHD